MWLKIRASKDRQITEHFVKEFSVREGNEGAFYIEFRKQHSDQKGQLMVRDFSAVSFGKENRDVS